MNEEKVEEKEEERGEEEDGDRNGQEGWRKCEPILQPSGGLGMRCRKEEEGSIPQEVWEGSVKEV